MRYFGTLALLTIALFGSVEATQAANDTNTKTENSQNTHISNEIAPNILSWKDILERTVPEEVKETPVTSDLRERALERWRAKQSHLWAMLPEGTFTINASAYTAAADECGKSDGITASGIRVAENRTIACPPAYPFGVKIAIDGYGVYTCEDRGGAIKGNKFDIYMETKQEAFAFGRRNLTARVVR